MILFNYSIFMYYCIYVPIFRIFLLFLSNKCSPSGRWPKYCHSYRLFLEFDLISHTTSQDSCYSWRKDVQFIVYDVIGTWKIALVLVKWCFKEKRIIFRSNNCKKMHSFYFIDEKMLYRMVCIVSVLHTTPVHCVQAREQVIY